MSTVEINQVSMMFDNSECPAQQKLSWAANRFYTEDALADLELVLDYIRAVI